jgi:hypothetical protein
MIPQEAMITRVRTLCVQDPQILAALMYGSFTKIARKAQVLWPWESTGFTRLRRFSPILIAPRLDKPHPLWIQYARVFAPEQLSLAGSGR